MLPLGARIPRQALAGAPSLSLTRAHTQPLPSFAEITEHRGGRDDPRPRGARCFACEVKRSFFDLIAALGGTQCAVGGDGNYNALAGLLSCPCADVSPRGVAGRRGQGATLP